MKTLTILSLVLLISAPILASRFDITSNAKCVRQEGGHCVEWSQTGQVIEQIGACFPAETRVKTQERGFVAMKDLKIGEHVLTHEPTCEKDCEEYYTEVTGWIHRNPEVLSQFLNLNTNDGLNFYVSPFHNLADEYFDYFFAKDFLGLRPFDW